MMIRYVSGVNIINQVQYFLLNIPRYLINLGEYLQGKKEYTKFSHWIFNMDVKLNFFPFEGIKKSFLIF